MGVKLRERPGKGWYVFINLKGKRKAKAFGSNKKSAQLFAQKMAYRLKEAEQEGTQVHFADFQKPMPIVKDYLTKWQETYAEPNCKPSTYRGYARAIEQVLIPQFGHVPLNELEREHIRTLIAELTQQGKARGTIENCLVPLKAVYYQAMEDGVVTTNPAARLGRIFKRKKDRRAGIAPLEREEVSHLLNTVKEKFPLLYPLILCAVRTGLRQGELIGLQWGDVDFHGGFIEVRRGVVLRKETFKRPGARAGGPTPRATGVGLRGRERLRFRVLRGAPACRRNSLASAPSRGLVQRSFPRCVDGRERAVPCSLRRPPAPSAASSPWTRDFSHGNASWNAKGSAHGSP